MKFQFLKHRKVFYSFSLLLFLASFVSLVVFGLTPGIEFPGGSILEVEYEEERPGLNEIENVLLDVGVRDANIQLIGEKGVIIRTDMADEEIHREIMGALDGVKEQQFEAIGPAVGDELRNASFIAIVVASILVIIYIAISFREEDDSINSFKYGAVATGIAFLHDIFIIVGIFAVLGYLYGVQFTIPVAVALLTTLGYSINDTVVIFDRIRENLRKNKSGKDSLEKIIDSSLNQTAGRSLGTSVTTLCVLFSLLFLAGSTLYFFVLALIIGVVLGTYSSLFLAGGLVLDWNNLTDKRK